MKDLWESQLRIEKQKMEAETEKMKKEGEKLDMLNDQERAKLQDEIR